MNLLHCFIFLFRGEYESQIMSAMYLKSQAMVASASAVMWFHRLNANQWNAITNVPASDRCGPKSNTFCIYGKAAITAHIEAVDTRFRD